MLNKKNMSLEKRSTYRLGESRATRIFGEHHIDNTVCQSHAKINEIS